MKIEVQKELKEGSAMVTMSILEPEVGNYLTAVEAFGEEPINIGGQVKDSDQSTILVDLSDWYVKVTDIIANPIIMTFQSSQYGVNTVKTAEAWIQSTMNKIDTYVTTMSQKVDEFSGTTISDI